MGIALLSGGGSTPSEILHDGATAAKIDSNGFIGYFGRNKLINCNFEVPVNQKAIATRVTTTGAYNFDQWYYGTDSKLYQPVEFINLSASQVYVMNWSGTATCEYKFSTVGSSGIVADAGAWTAISKKGTLTAPLDVITGSKFLWIRFTGVTADRATLDKPQLEEGTFATPFERKTYQQNLVECKRYYNRDADCFLKMTMDSSQAYPTRRFYSGIYEVPMRVTPSASLTFGSDGGYNTDVVTLKSHSWHVYATTVSAGYSMHVLSYIFSAVI